MKVKSISHYISFTEDYHYLSKIHIIQCMVTLNKSKAIVISNIYVTSFSLVSKIDLNGNNLCHVLHMSSKSLWRDMPNKSFVHFKNR